jgi:hypothetical protein
MSNNVNLIGGVAYGSAASADALFSKASESLGTAADSAKLYYTNGIEGMYLLGSGHGLLAALLGNGVSVVGSNGGVVVSQGTTAGLKQGTTTSKSSSPSGSTTSSSTTKTTTTVGNSTDKNPGTSKSGDNAADSTIRPEADVSFPPNVQLDLPGTVTPAATAAVPEPSTIALMLAGLLGAGSLTRRRR